MSDYKAILKQAEIFYQVSENQLEWISALCQEHTFQQGELIFAEGEMCDELYIIAQGEVDIQINPGLVSSHPARNNHPVSVNTMRRGQSFGEIAMVDHGMRSASAWAAKPDTRLLLIPRKDLEALCEQHPQLGYRLMRNLAADLAMKMRSTDLRMREKLLHEQAQSVQSRD